MGFEDTLKIFLKGKFVQKGSSGICFDHGQFEIKTFPIYTLPFVNQISIILLHSIVVRYDHDSGICGGSSLFCTSQRGVITFSASTKGGGDGSCVFVRCFAGSYQPPRRNNERSLRNNK